MPKCPWPEHLTLETAPSAVPQVFGWDDFKTDGLHSGLCYRWMNEWMWYIKLKCFEQLEDQKTRWMKTVHLLFSLKRQWIYIFCQFQFDTFTVALDLIIETKHKQWTFFSFRFYLINRGKKTCGHMLESNETMWHFCVPYRLVILHFRLLSDGLFSFSQNVKFKIIHTDVKLCIMYYLNACSSFHENNNNNNKLLKTQIYINVVVCPNRKTLEIQEVVTFDL